MGVVHRAEGRAHSQRLEDIEGGARMGDRREDMLTTGGRDMKEQQPMGTGASFSRRRFLHTAALGGVAAAAGKSAGDATPTDSDTEVCGPPGEAERLLRYAGEFGGGGAARAIRNESSD